MLVNKENNIFY